MSRMSQERQKILLEFYPGRCLPVHLGHSDTVPTKEWKDPGQGILIQSLSEYRWDTYGFAFFRRKKPHKNRAIGQIAFY